MNVLEQHTTLNAAYQEINKQLNKIEITTDLLPTSAEIEAITPSSGKIETLGGKPGKDKFYSNEIVNIVKVIISHQNPPKASKKLLKRLNNLFK